MEFKTLVAVVLLLVALAVVLALIFFFAGNTTGTGLNKIVSWDWI